MKDRFSALIDVKSIVTLALTALFIVLAIRGNIPDPVMTIYTVVISFYFGTQVTKKAKTEANDDGTATK